MASKTQGPNTEEVTWEHYKESARRQHICNLRRGVSPVQAGYPYAHFTPPLPVVPFSGYPAAPGAFGVYPQQQLLQSIQVAIQQALQLVPQQLQQIQQLVQLLAQQSHQMQHTQGPQPFQIPSIGPSGWLTTQAGQPQLFTGQAGYVM